MREHILKLPKVELHSHLEGTIKPHLVHQIAQRNGIELDQNLFNDKGGYAWSDFGKREVNIYKSILNV